jgi:glycosyltransferase involved in cell wall biosynthesis
MSVSVIIPTYNRAHTITDAIRSALAQSFTDLEVIVVDDGSTDGTEARVREIADARVRYVRQANRGPAAARNFGVKAARRPLVAFLDSDDLWKPAKLEREVGFLAAHPEAQGVFSDAEKYEGDVRVGSWMRATPAFGKHLPPAPTGAATVVPPHEMFLCLLEEDPIVTIAVTLRREAFLRVGGFDETWRNFEDWEFFLRFARTERLGYIDEPLAVVHLSRDSLHLVRAEEGRVAMLARLRRTRRAAKRPDVRAAARRGIVRLRTRLCWYYLEEGRRASAMRTCLAGFLETLDPGLLVRAALVPVPETLRRQVTRPFRAIRRGRSSAAPTAA